jgi:hypothetical protein
MLKFSVEKSINSKAKKAGMTKSKFKIILIFFLYQSIYMLLIVPPKQIVN